MDLSRLEDFEWMLNYLKVIDSVNGRIIEELGNRGPKNISALAKSIRMPSTTVAFRVKKMMSEGYLNVRAKLDFPKLGLMKAVLFAEAKHGLEDKLLKAIETVGYWTYIAPCYGKFNGYYAIFSFPALYKEKLEDFLREARQMGILSDYVLNWTTNVYEVAPSFQWFNFDKKAWSFKWDDWMSEVQKASSSLPQRLREPNVYAVMVDKTDLLMLKEMEKDGTVGFTELAHVVKITPQGVRHRYRQHIIKRGLVADYEVAVFPYPVQSSDLGSVLLDFQNQAALSKFVNTLHSKPFILSYSKVIGQDSLIAHFYTPKTEFAHFMNSLNHLVQKGILKDFLYVMLDIASFKRQTVSYEFFSEGKWAYDNEEKMRKLSEIVPLKTA
jgi:DNA-binding Lrp family transcriptional regulator